MNEIDKYFKNKYEVKTNYHNLWFAFAMFGTSYFFVFKWNYLGLPFVFVLIGLFSFIVGLLLTWHSFAKQKKKVQGIVEEQEIYSLNSKTLSNSIGGVFFLGVGGLSGGDSHDYYVYYRKGRFGLIKDKCSTEEVELIMRDDIKPCVRTIRMPDEDGFIEDKEFIFVPKNTVKKQIKVTT